MAAARVMRCGGIDGRLRYLGRRVGLRGSFGRFEEQLAGADIQQVTILPAQLDY
jgi:hypothetical protein